MNIDLMTVSMMASLVVVASGVMFILETMLREDDSVSRLWSMGFLAGILSSVSYIIWSLDTEVWWAVAAGNAALVACGGFMWLGCRRFNDRSMNGAIALVAAFSIATAVAALLEGESGGAWAGAGVMFAGLAILPGAAAVESLRGHLGRIRITVVLAVVFAVESLYYITRTVVLLAAGPESELFVRWWGTIPTSVITVVLTVVAVVIASVLRAERAALRGRETARMAGVVYGVLDARSFRDLLVDALGRSRTRGEPIAVISVRILDLNEVTTAFGASEARTIRSAARRALRANVPTQAWIGADGDDAFLVATVVGTKDDAQKTADALHGAIRTALQGAGASVLTGTGTGIGIAVSTAAVDAAKLIEAARAAAAQADDTGVAANTRA